jgi:excisionase family DNA binding protein
MGKAKVSEYGKLLTVKQAAEVLAVKEVTVRSWLAHRRLTAHKINRSWRIPQSEIERLLDQTLIPAAPRG